MRLTLLMLALLGMMCMMCMVGCASEAEATSKSPEALVEEIIDNLGEMNRILARVDDPASARAAAPRLTQLTQQWHAIEQQLVSMDEPDESTQQRVHELYENQIAGMMITLLEHVMRLNEQPGVMNELEDALPFTSVW